VAAKLGLDGLVNVQTKADGNGVPHLLEVNTRPSGGVGFSAAVGINLPYACARMMLGNPFEKVVVNEPVIVRKVDLTIKLPETTRKLREGQAV
jgi:predicted ATP-grasp superfamily ATP-dependent carboligase